MKRSKIKWVAARGLYTIDRVEHVAVDLPYTGTDGRQYGRVPAKSIHDPPRSCPSPGPAAWP